MGRAHRLVESQELTATLALADTLAEQDVLEAIIDAAKPPAPADCRNKHYLLSTPFRYPPLRHGSRFGRRTERGILYAARQMLTCMAEVAYYRFCWWHDMLIPPPKPIDSCHTLFEFSYRTDSGIDLSSYQHAEIGALLADPAHYRATQNLGSRLREQRAELLVYPSARCLQNGRNIAIFSPLAVFSSVPEMPQTVLCHTRGERVFFVQSDKRYEFSLEDFLINAMLPRPSA